jgi:hypothetical protein
MHHGKWLSTLNLQLSTSQKNSQPLRGWLFKIGTNAGEPPGSIGRSKAELRFGALGVGLGLATRLLRRRFERAEPTDFVHDSLSVEFALQAFESAIDGLSFANDNFRHFDFPWGGGLKNLVSGQPS